METTTEEANTPMPEHTPDPKNPDFCVASCPRCALSAAAVEDDLMGNPGKYHSGSLGGDGVADNPVMSALRDRVDALHKESRAQRKLLEQILAKLP